MNQIPTSKNKPSLFLNGEISVLGILVKETQKSLAHQTWLASTNLGTRTWLYLSCDFKLLPEPLEDKFVALVTQLVIFCFVYSRLGILTDQ